PAGFGEARGRRNPGRNRPQEREDQLQGARAQPRQGSAAAGGREARGGRRNGRAATPRQRRASENDESRRRRRDDRDRSRAAGFTTRLNPIPLGQARVSPLTLDYARASRFCSCRRDAMATGSSASPSFAEPAAASPTKNYLRQRRKQILARTAERLLAGEDPDRVVMPALFRELAAERIVDATLGFIVTDLGEAMNLGFMEGFDRAMIQRCLTLDFG